MSRYARHSSGFRRLFAACLLFSSAALPLHAWAVDTDGDGFADSMDAFPNDASLPKQAYAGNYVFSGGFSNAIGAGDVDNDGVPDLIMGASTGDIYNQNHSGIVRVISGKQRKLLYSFSESDGGFGGVGAVGDVDNDGYADFATTAPSENHNGLFYVGKVDIYSGQTGALLYRFYGDELGAGYLGWYGSDEVAALGDLNGDGYGDFALASSSGGDFDSGMTAVISGRDGSTIRLITDGGPKIANAGDVNADGYADMIIGDAYYSGQRGRLRIVSGWDGSTLYDILGPTFVPGDTFGFGLMISGVGDVNADGYADFAEGADSGGARVFSGKTGAVLYTIPGGYGLNGMNVSDAGDIDKDGYADFAVGCYTQTLSGRGMGTVRVYSGKTGEVLETYSGVNSDAYFGTGIDNAGDIDGDGRSDLVIASIVNNGGMLGPVDPTSYVVTITRDSDGDGEEDGDDDFPNDNAHSGNDSDGDGQDDVVDTDDDADGISDATEKATYKSNPKKTDSDDDGLPDSWEIAHGRQPAQADYEVAAGGDFTCAKSNSAVKCWGDNTYGQAAAPVLSGVKQVSSGRAHACALTGSGVACWGRNNKGQTLVPGMGNPYKISAGGEFTCALYAGGSSVWCWGDNSYGQLNVPRLGKAAELTSGNAHSCALDGSGVHCWGDNSLGQLNVPALSHPSSLSASGNQTCALDDGVLKCWGSQNGTAGDAAAAAPALASESQVSIGSQHGCVEGKKGIRCWGDNAKQQLAIPALAIDPDLDGVTSENDAFPLDSTENLDSDGDGIGNNSDTDDDNDGLADASDNCPLNSNASQSNVDGDTYGDACDSDNDNDGVADINDAFPFNAAESQDTDLDGIGNNADTDDDGDGVADGADNCPLVGNANQSNVDGDAYGDACDSDDDNDGVADSADNCPLVAAAQNDADADGQGDACDSDDDNDGVLDANDNCPFNANFDQQDTDHDGTGNACDVDTSGKLDPGFNPFIGAGGTVKTTGVQSNGKILIGGYFTAYNGTTQNYIARIKSDSALDTTFTTGTGANGAVLALAVQPDDKLLIGGSFATFNGTTMNRLARLNADGSLDTAFNVGTGPAATVQALALQTNGKVLVGGDFGTFNGKARNKIARLNGDGSVDTTFTPSNGATGGGVFSLAVQPDGKLLIGGDFTAYNGTTRNRIARINADGSLDTTFNPGTGANAQVAVIRVQTDGKLLIGGAFTTINAVLRNYIARLNSDGSLDTTFNPAGNDQVVAMAMQADGKLLVGGLFTRIGGAALNRIARLNADGSLDSSFNVGSGANAVIRSMTVQANGRLVIAGNFTTYNGENRNRVAVIHTGDMDGDGIDNAADADSDNDGVPDSSDAFPLDPTETLDTDHDGIGNNADGDDDGDGVPDYIDANPLDPAIQNEITLPLNNTYKGGQVREVQSR